MLILVNISDVFLEQITTDPQNQSIGKTLFIYKKGLDRFISLKNTILAKIIVHEMGTRGGHYIHGTDM